MAAIVFRNNKYNVVYSVKDEDGKRKQKWESFKTEAEAKADFNRKVKEAEAASK